MDYGNKYGVNKTFIFFVNKYIEIHPWYRLSLIIELFVKYSLTLEQFIGFEKLKVLHIW